MNQTSLYRCVLLVLAVSLAAPSSAQATPDGSAPSEALYQEAAEYARTQGVDLDVAVDRLRLQRLIGDLDARLRSEENETFAGLWIEHAPAYRVVTRFTSALPEKKLRASLGGTPLAGLVEVRSARWSLAELSESQAASRNLARTLDIAVDLGINVFENRVEIYATDTDALESGLRARRLALPENVVLVAVDGLVEPVQQTIRGGQPLSSCTAGFAVRRNTSGEVGLSTAAHCGNSQSALGVSLPFRSEDQNGNQDVQWHSTCGLFDVDNTFNSGIGNRACIGTRHRNNQAIGSYVCKWGMTTGRTCGFIQSKSIAPGYVQNAAATFVRIDGAVTLPGDSGGPVFVEDIAYGITSGRFTSDDDNVYMPINYISSLGVSVLTFDPGPCVLPATSAAITGCSFDGGGFRGPIVGGPLDGTCTAQINGSGICHYRWRVDGSQVDAGSRFCPGPATVTGSLQCELGDWIELEVTSDTGTATDTWPCGLE